MDNMNDVVNQVIRGCFCYSATLRFKYGDEIRHLSRPETEEFFRNHGAFYDAKQNCWYDKDDPIYNRA